MMGLKHIIFILIFYFSIIPCHAQSEKKANDTISGFYLTKSFDGFTGQNFETLVLEEKPYIYINEIKKVSQDFNFRNQPFIHITLNNAGKEKLKEASLKFQGKPLVVVFETKTVMAPTINGLIENGELQISGNFTLQETTAMTNWIKKRIEK